MNTNLSFECIKRFLKLSKSEPKNEEPYNIVQEEKWFNIVNKNGAVVGQSAGDAPILRVGPSFPNKTPEYVKAEAPLWEKLEAQSIPFYKLYKCGAIDHFEYANRIESFWKAYRLALEPHWVKAGGIPTKKQKT